MKIFDSTLIESIGDGPRVHLYAIAHLEVVLTQLPVLAASARAL